MTATKVKVLSLCPFLVTIDLINNANMAWASSKAMGHIRSYYLFQTL